MNINRITLPEPPKVLKSIRSGFDATTKHLALLLFPISLDLVLWFGPRFKLKSLIGGLVAEMNAVSQLLPADFYEVMEAGQEIWTAAGERLNLVIALRSFPVGIFSLFTSILPLHSPLGQPLVWDLPTPGLAVLIGLGLFLAGLVLGGLYFSAVRQAAIFDELKWRKLLGDWPRVSLQSLLLSLIWVGFFSAIGIIASCAATGVTFFSVALGQIMILLFGILSFWLIFPLFFSPHGIFFNRQKAWKSMLSSIRLTNLTFMRTSLFILIALITNQGLNMLWRVPPDESWMLMISVLGHAFVVTGMLAASFIYYQDMNRWAQELKALGFPRPILDENPPIEN